MLTVLCVSLLVEDFPDIPKGSIDSVDPMTTNLYVGNINPKVKWLLRLYL